MPGSASSNELIKHRTAFKPAFAARLLAATIDVKSDIVAALRARENSVQDRLRFGLGQLALMRAFVLAFRLHLEVLCVAKSRGTAQFGNLPTDVWHAPCHPAASLTAQADGA